MLVAQAELELSAANRFWLLSPSNGDGLALINRDEKLVMAQMHPRGIQFLPPLSDWTLLID